MFDLRENRTRDLNVVADYTNHYPTEAVNNIPASYVGYKCLAMPPPSGTGKRGDPRSKKCCRGVLRDDMRANFHGRTSGTRALRRKSWYAPGNIAKMILTVNNIY